MIENGDYMDFFKYRSGQLYVEDVPVEQIAADVGTPLFIYSASTLRDHYEKIRNAYSDLDIMVCFSVKACGNINILKLLASYGSGFDIVSGGELFRVLQARGSVQQIVYAGVGKTDREICQALDAGIGYFNIESEAEMINLVSLAHQHDRYTKVALRVNPDVDYQTHQYLTTGKKENKFGVDIEQALKLFREYGHDSHVKLCALHIHLGTGGKKIDPYVEAVEKILPLIDQLRSEGYHIDAIDLGGGYGAAYESDAVPSAEDYASGIVPLLKDRALRLILEPGKSICANAGILLTNVVYTKQGPSKKFIIVDAGMNDLIRPALYDAFHFIWPTQVASEFVPVRRSKNLLFKGTETVDIVGPICESGDFLAKDRGLPPVERGDHLAVFTAGAYGFSMSSNYNARCRAAEVLVDGDQVSVIRRRETYDDLIALERIKNFDQ